jgi:hypothetical protein
MTSRGASGWAAACSAATVSSTSTSRSVPYRRRARFGLSPVTGSTVTKLVPAAGSSTPPTSRPWNGFPTARERRHTIAASAGLPLSIAAAPWPLWTAADPSHASRLRSPTGGVAAAPAH